MTIRYLLRKCTRIRELDVSGTAVDERHLKQLCKASISLVLLKFAGPMQAYAPTDPRGATVLRVLKEYPRVILFNEYTGFVFVGIYHSSDSNKHPRLSFCFWMLNV